MIKMKSLILTISFLLLFLTTAFSYDIQVIGNIPLKDNLTGISINPATGIAVAVSSGTKTLYMIDIASSRVIKKISLTITPSGVVVDPNRNSAIVSSKDGSLYFFDLEKESFIKSHPELVSGSINALALNPPSSPFSKGGIEEGDFVKGGIVGFSNLLYIGTTNSLMVMNLETGDTLKEVPLPYTPISMAIDPDPGYLAILHQESGILHLYNAETLEPITDVNVCSSSSLTPNSELPTPNCSPSGVAINPSTHIAVIINYSDNSISIVSLSDIRNPVSGIMHLPFYESPSAVSIDHLSNIAYISHKDGIVIVKLENPVPQINNLIPQTGRAGDPGFILSIEGSKFIRDSQAQFNNKNVPTYFLTNEKLEAGISSGDLSKSGDVPVTVTNPPPKGGISNPFTFRIYNPAPVLESISPDTIHQTQDSRLQTLITLRATGKNFLNGSKVNLNGENLKTKFISSILLEAEINPSIIKSPGRYLVVVINPSPGAYTSNLLYLNVVEETAETRMSLRAEGEAISTDEIPRSARKDKKGTGTLRGRILNTHKQPVEGVTVEIKNIKAVTDADGYFTLDNVPSGKRHLMVHGQTAKNTRPEIHSGKIYSGLHPTIPLSVDINEGSVNDMPFQIYLHRQKDRNFKEINPSEDTVLTDPEVPGFEMKIPKGVNIKGWDGKHNQKVSVRTVPTDRLPVKPLPKNAYVRTIYMFYFDKVGGGIPDAPIPVKFPNDLGLLPGQKALLWYYDESPNEGEAPNDWAIAGTGTVTPDGRYIVSDEGVGIPKFCCGATGPGCGDECPPGPGPDPCP